VPPCRERAGLLPLTLRRVFCYTVSRRGRLECLPVMDLDIEAIKSKVAALKTEHRELDEMLVRLSATVPVNHLQMQRLKKRKLALKDLIIKLETKLLPDIIA
jgi:hypothetical protein